MEGNLYQLTKSRKGRPLAAGLIASCFHQMVSGLQHVHRHGYFHRDMKPENLLVTTTGLCEYLSTKAVEEINARRAAGDTDFQLHITDEKDPRIQMDVQVIIKLADFGLARAINSKPPYTEYVSTRWYRAPEVLLRATDYGAPVDMWALGTILAEMINLKPLFPGSSEIDQVYKICEVLGDPSPDYGPDENGRIHGGGRWNTGIKLAKRVGFSFPKRKPLQLRALFPKETPRSLIDCVANLLRYNPRYRMTSDDCMTHLYFREVMPHLQRVPPLPRIPFSWGQPSPRPTPSAQQPPMEPNLNVPSRPLPPSHSHHEPHSAFANGDMRTLPPPESTVETPVGELITPNGPPSGTYFTRPYPQEAEQRAYGASALVRQLRELDLPTDDLASYGARRWSEAELVASRQRYANSVHAGSVHAGSVHSIPDSISNPSYSNLNSLSAISLDRLQPQTQHPHQTPDPHVMAYVRQQAAYQQQMQQPAVSQSTPNLTPTAPAADPNSLRQAQSTMTLPLPSTNHMPPPDTHMAPPSQATSKLGPPPPPAPSGKKKKWGLSSVFGGAGGKSGTSLPSVDEHSAATTSLKRTQSGQYADDRIPPGPQSPVDPKMSKKEAERQSRELLKAKREAAERAQKERARAVLNKRAQLVSGRNVEVEYLNITTDNITPPVNNGLSKQASRPVAGYPSGYPSSHGSTLQSASIPSLASFPGPGQSPYLQVDDGIGRNKARKQSEEDDHSSIGRASAKSRSLLSVATMESE
jgi:meiosis induction protein kinase IME2/SME1